MRRTLAIALLTIAAGAPAAPGPPPPAYVWKAGEILSSTDGLDPAKIAPLFAEDVKVSENGKPVAAGKTAWLAWRAARLAHYNGRTIGFSDSSGGHEVNGGELLVVDTFDTVDRTNLPPTFIADARMATRSTLYQFARDGLIHAVRIERTGGFWMVPR